MSYIRAKLAEVSTVETGKGQDEEVVETDLDQPDLDMNLDDEILDFILALIAKVNDLGESEALVVWKEIF